MRNPDLVGALPALLVFLGVGLLFVTTVAGFVPAIYQIGLPGGLLLFLGGLAWVLLKPHPPLEERGERSPEARKQP